ncbi:MAG: hypothetical protein M1434_03540 [Chloroflexi bacterium]|nr:hypothetical protein [Chloroflexota bacterium]MCL5273804.1 hypothetical protein [Chloroflexota bacterium]
MQFTDLLSLPVTGEMVAGRTACLLAIGDGANPCAAQLAATSAGDLAHSSGEMSVYFGLPVLTLPYPILVNSLMSERNTRFDQLSLFGWLEDNAILEPRAEIVGLTPLAEDPVLFVRDLDLDRPPECYVMARPARWLRVAGVVIARRDHAGAPAMLNPADGALSALEVSLPASLQPLAASLRAEVASGGELRLVLRARRRGTDPAIMALCDGWRVLARAARFMLSGPAWDAPEQARRLFRLDAPRRW